ncbi:hypothetical protein SLA2020_156470 [Shorea laevis]
MSIELNLLSKWWWTPRRSWRVVIGGDIETSVNLYFVRVDELRMGEVGVAKSRERRDFSLVLAPMVTTSLFF